MCNTYTIHMYRWTESTLAYLYAWTTVRKAYSNVCPVPMPISIYDEKPLCEYMLSLFIWPFQMHANRINTEFILKPKSKIKNNSNQIKRQWQIKNLSNKSVKVGCFCLHSSIMFKCVTQMFVMTNIQNERNDKERERKKTLYYTILYIKQIGWDFVRHTHNTHNAQQNKNSESKCTNCVCTNWYEWNGRNKNKFHPIQIGIS